MLVHRSATPTLDRSFDRAFEQLTTSFFETRRPHDPVVDGAWADGEYVLTVDLPGVAADSVSVEVTGTTLSIGVSTDSLTWQRALRLGGRLDADKVSARHLDGRLTVRVGTVDEPEAHSIAIHTSAPERSLEEGAIEATTDDQSTDTIDGE